MEFRKSHSEFESTTQCMRKGRNNAGGVWQLSNELRKLSIYIGREG